MSLVRSTLAFALATLLFSAFILEAHAGPATDEYYFYFKLMPILLVILGILIFVFASCVVGTGVASNKVDKDVVELETRFQTMDTKNEELKVKVKGLEEEKHEYVEGAAECKKLSRKNAETFKKFAEKIQREANEFRDKGKKPNEHESNLRDNLTNAAKRVNEDNKQVIGGMKQKMEQMEQSRARYQKEAEERIEILKNMYARELEKRPGLIRRVMMKGRKKEKDVKAKRSANEDVESQRQFDVSKASVKQPTGQDDVAQVAVGDVDITTTAVKNLPTKVNRKDKKARKKESAEASEVSRVTKDSRVTNASRVTNVSRAVDSQTQYRR